VSESYLGRALGPRQALSRATPLLGRLILCSILFTMAVMIGLVLFFFPGVIAGVGLILAFPSLVLEDLTPSAALGRSWELTRGFRWRMFGLLVTLLVLLYIPITALSGVASMMVARASASGGTSTLVAVLLGAVIQLLLYPLFYCVLTVAYYDLRVRKEGFDLEVLASTLQSA
jgi:membrane-anchored glycerophosphoryl diester phosphodiesterase (GDPDase)